MKKALSSYLSKACPKWRRSSKPPAGMKDESGRGATYLRQGDVVIRCTKQHGCFGYSKQADGSWGYGAYAGNSMIEACRNVANVGATFDSYRPKRRGKK